MDERPTSLDHLGRVGMGAVDAWITKHDRPRAFNISWEMQQMVLEMIPDEIKVVVEIGTFQGDSLRIWRELLDPELLIGVQDTEETTPEVAAELGAQMVIAKSQDPWAHATVLEKLGGRAIDLLYIDGDHMYPAVKRDWELYSPLVRPGGIIVLHDAVIEDNDTVEVYQFYREIREGRQTKLIYGGQHSTGACIVFP